MEVYMSVEEVNAAVSERLATLNQNVTENVDNAAQFLSALQQISTSLFLPNVEIPALQWTPPSPETLISDPRTTITVRANLDTAQQESQIGAIDFNGATPPTPSGTLDPYDSLNIKTVDAPPTTEDLKDFKEIDLPNPDDLFDPDSLNDIKMSDDMTVIQDAITSYKDSLYQAENESLSSISATALYAKLTADMAAGVTGINPTVERQIWDRMSERDELIRQRTVVKMADDHARFGWDLPQGTLKQTVTAFETEYGYKKMDESRSVAEDQAKMSLQNQQFTTSSMLQVLAVEVQHYDQVKNRALTAMRSVFEFSLGFYNAWISKYAARVSALIKAADVQLALLGHQISKNEMLLKAFTAKLDKEKTDYGLSLEYAKTDAMMQVEKLKATAEKNMAILKQFDSYMQALKAKAEGLASVIAAKGSAFGAKVGAYSAEVGLQKARADVGVAVAGLTKGAAEFQTQILAQQAQLAVRALIASMEIRADTAKAGGNIWATAIAGALNANQALIQLGATSQVIGSDRTV